jgi:hypothetical protein
MHDKFRVALGPEKESNAGPVRGLEILARGERGEPLVGFSENSEPWRGDR